ncbi:MAG: NAD(P)H-dependent glycerol-3-phosphate dehydrogenase [Acidimicrobiales bacterium]
MEVTVLGAGSWGTTIAGLLSDRHRALLWARDPEVAEEVNERHTNHRYLFDAALPPVLEATADLAEAAARAEVLIVAVPSAGFRVVVEKAAPAVAPGTPLVSLTKGIETGSLLRMTEVLTELLPGHPVAALTGPNLAGEIVSGHPAAGVLAAERLEVAELLREVIGHRLLRLYVNHDLTGCELGGSLKNVVAIAVGVAQGLGAGANACAAVMTRGLAEITRLSVAMGAHPATLAGLAGMGDLVATCMSPLSRNRSVGEQLGRGLFLDDILADMHMVAEGVATAGVALQLARRHGVAVPMCADIELVLRGDVHAREAQSLQLRPGLEADPG